MNSYRVTCEAARELGAIGIFYPITKNIDAKSEMEAEAKFRDKHECNRAVVPVRNAFLRFAADWGIDIDRVGVIVRLARECGKLNEKATNGDPHPRNPNPDDKNRNMELWSHDCDVATAELLRYVETYGFTAIAYTGLYPTLKRGAQFVEVPY